MEKLKNLFKKERKSSEKIEDVRENIKSMFETSDKELAKLSDVTIIAPSNETYIIQEMHLPIYHCLCLMLEEFFFG